MFKTIRIGDKDVGMLANAASPYIFKQVFNEDLLKKFAEMETDLDQSIGEKMGFVFAKQAETDDMSALMKLNMDNFLTWLSGFDPLDVYMASEEIVGLYQEQKGSTSVPKEEGE